MIKGNIKKSLTSSHKQKKTPASFYSFVKLMKLNYHLIRGIDFKDLIKMLLY